MKARIDAIIQREQAEYLDCLIPQTDPLLKEMEDYAAKHRVPIADREVALFLENLGCSQREELLQFLEFETAVLERLQILHE